MVITSAKLQPNGWFVNGTTSVPNDKYWSEQIAIFKSGGGIVQPEVTETELLAKTKAEIESAIQTMLDTKARQMRYDSMMSARSYAGFANPFQTEAQTLAAWCANCWTKAGELEALGTPMTVDEVLAQMPVYGA